MVDQPDKRTKDCQSDNVPQSDVTGRDRITRNVLASWGGYGVFIVAGFIMPRLIDTRIGQEALGVWDFAWSLVAYFSLVQAGVVSSVNRFVAKYQAVGDLDGVNRAVSSVSCVLLIMGIVVLGLTVSATLAVPRLLSNQLAGYVGDAKWLVFLLGVSLAVQIAFSGFGGVITGCHRWDLHNYIDAGSYAATVAGMIAVLSFGGGLPGLALMNLCGQVAGRAVRCVLAYRVFPGLHVRLAYAHWSDARRMIAFGGKSFVHSMTELLLNQTTNILILAYLGPASLAVYARPRALVRHVTTLVRKYAYVLGPTASSLHAVGQKQELGSLLTQGTRYAAYIALPMILVLAILGGPILHLWMGSHYEHGPLLAILAVGYFGTIIQESVLAVLWGMNLHGRPGLAKLAAGLCVIAMVIVMLGPLRLGLIATAIAVTVPLTIVNGVYVPIYACHRTGLSVRQYLRDAMQGPVLCAIPFGLSLVGVRIVFAGNPLVTLAYGGLVGGVVLALLYWKYVLPSGLKIRLTRRLSLLRSSRCAKPM
ncbi:MAG: oligosaccharide flippase family protein [Phycisphaerae bacterium]